MCTNIDNSFAKIFFCDQTFLRYLGFSAFSIKFNKITSICRKDILKKKTKKKRTHLIKTITKIVAHQFLTI